jgi:uncharacterized membrane protein (UPF0182 family)
VPRRRWLITLVAIAAAVLLMGRFVSGLVVDYRWYAAAGAAAVWWTRVVNLLELRAAGALVAIAFVFLNLYAVRQSVVSLVLPRRVANLEIGAEVPPRLMIAAVAVLSLVTGLLLSLALEDWQSLVLVRDGVLFQESDPYFSYDLGFFVYWLPFETTLRLWSLLVLVVVTAMVTLLYALTPSLKWEQGTLRVSGYVRRHLTVLGAVLLLILAWGYRIDAYTLLIDGSGPDGAFMAVDHRVGIPVDLLLAFLTATAALLVLWAGWTNQIRLAFGTVTVVLLLSLGLRQLLPIVAARLISPADEGAREQPYIATRAGYTRRAFGVDRIARDDSTYGYQSLREAALAVPIWDGVALARAVERSSRRGEVNGAVGWASDSGRIIAHVVQRPAGPESADPFSPWLVSEVLGAAADDRGAFVTTSRTAGGAEPIPPALVYDGATGYLVVTDSAGVVAAPALDAWWVRLAHAWDQQNPKLLFGDLPGPSARILLRRDVRGRVRRLLPFFGQGREVVPMLHGDTLYWALHLYASSEWYPLSSRIRSGDEHVSYLYHAGLAVVNATTGRVEVVADSVLDPVAATWRERFSSLFFSRESLPRELIAEFPPAIDGALAQASAFARVGVRNEAPVASHLPGIAGSDTVLAEGETALFVSPATGAPTWAIPILDAGDRVRGLVVAEGGRTPDTRWVPFASAGPRWPTLVDRLQHVPDSVAAPQGARLVRGRVRVIPSGRGAYFVQSTYAWRPEGAPLLTRVAVLHGDSVVAGRSLADLAGIGARARAPIAPATLPELRERVQQLYGEMNDALRRGDWSAFGRAFDALGRLLRAAPRDTSARAPASR